MLRAVSDHRDPQIAVLMTGDGAGYDDGVGFHADMAQMHAAGPRAWPSKLCRDRTAASTAGGTCTDVRG